MRVLFSPHRDPQHLYPMVPLAWACRTAGHEVRIAAAPALADSIVHTGLPAVRVGTDVPPPTGNDDRGMSMVYQHRQLPPDWSLHPELLDDGQRAAIEVLGRNSAIAAGYIVDDLIEFARYWRPDLVIHDTAGFAGAVTAAAIGVPNVRFLTGVGLRPMETRVASSEPLPAYAEIFQRRGVGLRVVPTITIDPSPPSLRLPVADPWRETRYVAYNGPGVAPYWLAVPTERPRVCITWGLSVSRVIRRLGPQALEPFRLAIEALSELEVDIIVASTADQLELLGALPGNVRAETDVALHLALPYCALVVHQGGDGTALTAAASGIPQLLITRKPDPALTGGRLAGVGAAVHLRYRELELERDAGSVIGAAAMKILADSAYTQAAARLSAEIERQPAPAELVPALETLALDGG